MPFFSESLTLLLTPPVLQQMLLGDGKRCVSASSSFILGRVSVLVRFKDKGSLNLILPAHRNPYLRNVIQSSLSL